MHYASNLDPSCVNVRALAPTHPVAYGGITTGGTRDSRAAPVSPNTYLLLWPKGVGLNVIRFEF